MTSAQPVQSTQPLHRDWILVVDDDEPVRTLLLEVLRMGDDVEVVAAEGAEAALRIIDEHGTEPVLVLTDVMMPETNGLLLARKLSGQLKRSKIAIMSGHLNNISWWPVELRDITYISKPFRVPELLALANAARVEFPRD